MNASPRHRPAAPNVPAILGLLLLLGSASPGGVSGQQRPPAPPPGDTATAEAEAGVSPGGAFARALLIPGWGHAAAGAYSRGGFYFAAETGVGWMLFKTISLLGAAEDARGLRRAEVRRNLVAAGTRPDSVDILVDEDPTVQEAEGLVEARKDQREDWLALGVFLLLLGGADAFVSAHLADFPQPVEIDAAVLPAADRVEIGVSIPWDGPGGR